VGTFSAELAIPPDHEGFSTKKEGSVSASEPLAEGGEGGRGLKWKNFPSGEGNSTLPWNGPEFITASGFSKKDPALEVIGSGVPR
jgi:hypothetical protein